VNGEIAGGIRHISINTTTTKDFALNGYDGERRRKGDAQMQTMQVHQGCREHRCGAEERKR
jgi:hypothetical protein